MHHVDVFIFHHQDDAKAARNLKTIITDWGYSCHCSADDPDPDPESGAGLPAAALADRIRGRLRSCRCLIHAFCAGSGPERWLPWQLGFFDGRWGARHIGLYSLDGGDAPVTLGDFAGLYTALTPGTLRSFLEDTCSTRALAGRADVDVERMASLMAGAMNNPVEFWVGCLQYFVGFQQQLWRPPAPGSPFSGLMPSDPMTGFQMALDILRRGSRPFAPADWFQLFSNRWGGPRRDPE